MKSTTFSAIGTLLVCTGVAAENQFIIDGFANLMARINPIANPGRISDQVYSVIGASNIREVLNTPEEQQRAGCTGVTVGADKSNYWAPTLYYIHDNGTFSAMQADTRIYYKLNGADIQPWPKGMRIVTGTPMTKNNEEIRSRGISIGCHGNLAGTLPNAQWTTETCGDSNTVELAIDFPSCGWANQSLDSPTGDHFSHLSWPIDTANGDAIDPNGDACPPSHPIRYPTMRFVNLYGFNEETPFRKGKDNVALSSGDLDGTTFHADFVSGWDENVLRDAIATCGNVEANVGDCAAFTPTYQPDISDYAGSKLCPYQGQIPNEDIGLLYPIEKLPGCNPLWPVGQDNKPACGRPPPPPRWVSPNAWKSGGAQNFPFILKEEHKGMYNREDEAFAGRARFGPWGSLGRLDNSSLMMPADELVNGWLPEDPNPSATNTVKGMQDTSAWTGILPGDAGTDNSEEAAPPAVKVAQLAAPPPASESPSVSEESVHIAGDNVTIPVSSRQNHSAGKDCQPKVRRSRARNGM